MPKVEIEKEKFSKFLKLIALANDVENAEALVDVQEDGIKCLAVSQDKSLGTKAFLKHPFPKIGQVGLAELPKTKKIIDAVASKYEVEFAKNKFVVKAGKTTVSFPLKNAEYIFNKLDEDKFNSRLRETVSGISFKLTKEVCADIVKSFNLVGGSALTLKVKDDLLTLKVKNATNDIELETEILVDKSKKNFNIKIGKNFVDLLALISDEVKVSLSEDNPSALALEYSGDSYSFQYLVALVNQEETAEKKKEKVNV